MASETMRKFSGAMVLLGVCLLAGWGCSKDPAGGGNGTDGRCDSGERYSENLGRCVPDDGSTGGDGGGSTAGGDGGTTGGSTADGGTGNNNNNNACGKRSNYVQVYQPNVFLVIDRSSSMGKTSGGKTRWERVKAGLDTVADKVAGDVRIGASGFPIKSSACSSRRLLDLGEHTAQEIKDSYRTYDGEALEPGGGTPTGRALYQLRTQEWYRDLGDKNDAKRKKAVILITDGVPNDKDDAVCRPSITKIATNQAAKLYNRGMDPSIPVYVVGFEAEGDPAKLNTLAEMGGTDAPGQQKYYSTSSASDLSDALLKITDNSVGCEFPLNPPAPDGASVNVSLAGESIPKSQSDGYHYDGSSESVKITGSWCKKLQGQSAKGTTLEIDVGCPGCALAGESCSGDGDCCDGKCRGGVCKELCSSNTEECDSNDDCCSGTCAIEDGLTGTCVGQ